MKEEEPVEAERGRGRWEGCGSDPEGRARSEDFGELEGEEARDDEVE